MVSSKLQQAEAVKNKAQDSGQSNRKQKSLQKSFNKVKLIHINGEVIFYMQRSEKFETARLKCDRARNEYLYVGLSGVE